MKIGLVGYGYWGAIILKKLKSMGFEDIVICETNNPSVDGHTVISDYTQLECDKVFVITPASTHFGIVKHFLMKGIDVFCEKPLTLTEQECRELFYIADFNRCHLFVDWIFLFNEAVDFIKGVIEEKGPPKFISMNRLNKGPERKDVGAKWDLASHDLSILFYLLSGEPRETSVLEFKRNENSCQFDSCFIFTKIGKTAAEIHSSWEFPYKNRKCLFVWDDFVIEWDDTIKKVETPQKIVSFSDDPLEKSINVFLEKSRHFNTITCLISKFCSNEGSV